MSAAPDSRPRKLTPKQELFIVEYAKDFNATQAAIRAGYSGTCINRTASQLLDKTRHLIEQRQQVVMRESGAVEEPPKPPVSAIATLEQSLRLVTALAFYDHRQLYEGDQIKSASQLTRRQALMIADFQVDENFVKVGEQAEHVGYTKKVRLVDRAPYLNMLLKWHRAFPTGKTEPPKEPRRQSFDLSKLTDDELKEHMRLRRKAMVVAEGPST